MPPLPPTDHWITHPEGRLFARRWPGASAADAPLVLFHDSLGCVEVWRDWPEKLSRITGRTVIAYDRMGFGRSDARHELPPLDFVAEEAARYFPAVREQLGLQRFVALGHSVGGGMAIEVAAALPEACEALITLAAQIFPEARTLEGIRVAAVPLQDPAQVQRLAKYHGDKAPWVIRAWVDRWLDPAFAAWSLVPTLQRLKVPTLALLGAEDEYGSAVHPSLMAQESAGPVTVKLLAGHGHVPHRENPEQVAQHVADFLGGPLASSGATGLR